MFSLVAPLHTFGQAVTAGAVRTGKPVPVSPVTSIARSDFGMAATGSPEATEAAVGILERGGNAIDAAVAAALMLGVSDADASGLGGMTYMVIHLADGRTLVVDGTSPTPQGVKPERLRELKEKTIFSAMRWWRSLQPWRSSNVHVSDSALWTWRLSLFHPSRLRSVATGSAQSRSSGQTSTTNTS